MEVELTSPLIKSLIHLFVMLRLHYHDWRGAGFGGHKMKKIVAGLGNTYKSLHETDGSIRGTP